MVKINNEKIGFFEKAAFAMANLGNIPVTTIVSSFLLIFYTNVVGLDPAACATLFLITRVVDAVNDPFVGFLIDRFPQTRYGKFRVTLIIGSVLCALNYLLLWFGPLWSPICKLGIAYISYLLLGVLFPVMDISLNSLLPVMTLDMKERNALSTIKGAFYMIGGIAVGILAPIIIGDASEADGYVRLIIGAVIIVMSFSVIGAIGVKERVRSDNTQSYQIRDLFKIITLKPVLVIFISTLLYTAGTNMINAVNAYYFTYVINDLEIMSIASLLTMVFMFPGLFISSAVSGKKGKKNAYIAGLLMSALAPMIRLFDVDNVAIIMISAAATAVGTGVLMGQMYSIQADNTDYVEIATGQRAEGAVASLNSFSSKFAMGIGGSLPGYMMALANFDANQSVQPEGVNQVIIAFSTYIPGICTVIAALIVAFCYPLTKEKLAQQVEEIKKRHS